MARIRTCIIDGKKYKYCPRCAEYINEPSWKMIYCSDNCKDIDIIVNEYSFDHLTKDEAKEKLENCDLSNIENFNDEIKDAVKSIISDTSKKRRRKSEVAEETEEISE